MSPYLLHLRRSVLIFVAPALAVAGTMVAWSAVYPSVSSSANIANVVVSTGGVLAPILAGFAAWDGLRERRHGGGPILEVAVQPTSRIVLLQTAAGLTHSVSIYIVIIAVLHVRAYLLGPVGAPLWVNLAISLLSFCVATAIGYLIAGLMKHWFAVLAASLIPALLFGHALFGQGGGFEQSLIPFGDRAGGDFLDPNVPFFWGQLLVVGGVLLLALGGVAASSHRDRSWGVAVMVCAVAAGASGIWTVGSQHHRWGIPVDDAQDRLIQLESEDHGLTLSVLPTYLPVRAELLERWARVQRILAETPAAFTELRQLSDSHPQPSKDAGSLTLIYLNPSSGTVAENSVLESLVDVHTTSCEASRTFETALVELWLAGDGAETGAQLMPEHAAALAALRELDEDEAQAWMTTRFEKFADCGVVLADFPARG